MMAGYGVVPDGKRDFGGVYLQTLVNLQIENFFINLFVCYCK